MNARVNGAPWGIRSARDLARLGETAIRVRIAFRGLRLLDLLHHPPPERLKLIDARYADCRARLLGQLSDAKRVVEKANHIDATLHARRVASLAKSSAVESLTILSDPPSPRVRGHETEARRWYAVCALIAIQVEGVSKGLQSYETRIVLVSAKDEKGAASAFAREYRSVEEKPYLNACGEFVRWKLESIVETYETDITSELNPRGTEVFATLGRRRLKRGLAWRPKPSELE